jgi:Spy/CpxP family protein refolding chaperone
MRRFCSLGLADRQVVDCLDARTARLGRSPSGMRKPPFGRLLAFPALAVTAVLFSGALAATGPSAKGPPGAGPTLPRSEAAYLSLPGLWELRTENVQKELDLTNEQRDRLRAMGQKFYEEMRQAWAGIGGMSPVERKNRYAEIRQRSLTRMRDTRKQVEAMLSPDQSQRLKQINLRTRSAAALANPEIVDQLRITEQQQQRLQEIQQSVQRLQQEALDVLTPQQRRKLEELTTEAFGIRRAGPTVGGQ